MKVAALISLHNTNHIFSNTVRQEPRSISQSINLYCTHSFLLKKITKFDEIINNKVGRSFLYRSPPEVNATNTREGHACVSIILTCNFTNREKVEKIARLNC